MNEPFRYRVLNGFGFYKILIACLTLLIVQLQVLPVFGFDEVTLQQQVVSGVVTDETGAPFPFVTVYVEGMTSIGVITNDKGEYRVTVPQNSTLNFAFVGYKTLAVPVGDREVINVQMELEMKALDEVVVVGFGEQRRASVSAAVTTIKAEDIVQSPVANITNALAGRLPGLTTIQNSGQPGMDDAALYIRGRGTWNSATPLYVIDGVERSSAIFSSMDPSEIETFTVLKDAAATAVYGTKGANGVVLINTKRGQEGATAVSVNVSTTLQQFTRYPQYLNSYESVQLYNESLMNDGLSPVFSDYDIEMFRTEADPYRYPNTDWYKLMMKKVAPMYNASFNYRGGSRTVRYFFSGSYLRQEGQLKTTQGRVYNPRFAYQRYRVTANVDALLTDVFTISVNMGGTHAATVEPREELEIFRNMNRLAPWYMPAQNPDGSYAGNAEFPQFNPYYLLQTRGSNNMVRNRLTSSIKLDFNFDKYIKGLSADIRGAYDSSFGSGQYWSETQSTYQLISRSGRADRYLSYLEPVFFGSSIDSDEVVDRKLDILGNIVYSRRFGEHRVRLQGISNISEQRILSNIPYNSVSFIGRVNYGFKNKYNLEANASYRGSENFAPGHRFGLFPSVSASWNIHEEAFMESLAFIDLLKLRTSYGISGNDYAGTRFLYKEGKWTTGTGSYATFGSTTGTSLGYTEEPAIANPLATWETAQQVNFGVDIALYRSNVSLTVDRFFEWREGILQEPRSVSSTLGIGLPDMNIGKSSRNGYEIELAVAGKLSSDLGFSIRPNIAFSTNKVVFRDEPEDMEWWLKQEGKPIGQYWGYVVLGYFRDQQEIDNSPEQQVGGVPIPGDFRYLDFNGDGVVNDFDRLPIEYSTTPRYTFGTTFSMKFKNLSATVHFQGTSQASTRLEQFLMYEFYNRGKVMEHHLGRWTPETHETATYPVLHFGGTSQNHVYNTYFIMDRSYLRLKTAEIAYSLSPRAAKALGLKGLRIYVSGVNLLTWDRLKVVDPETSPGASSHVYPQARNYSMGFNLNF